MARALVLLVFFSAISGARAQDGADEARASELRAAARAHLAAGRIEDAFGALREAAELTRDPTVWLEVGETADRLRIDDVALAAYERYLEERADAPDRAEIEGRVRVLRRIAAGHRYAVAPTRRGLVDWEGRPVPLRRPGGLVTLAEWDEATPRAPELLPFPGRPTGLGRRLSPP